MPLTARYYRNRTYRMARHLTKRFQEQAPYAVPPVVERFEELARFLHQATDPRDIQDRLLLIEDFCKDVERGKDQASKDAQEGGACESVDQLDHSNNR